MYDYTKHFATPTLGSECAAERKKYAWMAFFIGLGALTRVFFFGCMSFTEFFVFAYAPKLIFSNTRSLKRDGVMTMLWLVLCANIMAVAVSIYNQVHWIYALKASAVFYSLISHTIVFHRILTKNPRAIGYFFVGLAISGIITIFAFNPKAAVSETGAVYIGTDSAEAIMSGPLFWIEKCIAFLSVPVQGWYLQTPIAYSVIAPIIVSIVAMKSSGSGRSAALVVVLGAFLILLGKKSRRTLKMIGRYFLLVALSGLVVISVFKFAYTYAAEHGMLTEDAVKKYEKQTRKGKGLVSLITSGRIEPFIGLTAAIDNPIFGFGLVPIDRNGYTLRAFELYGAPGDAEEYLWKLKQNGYPLHTIQTHSHIIGYWVMCGLPGLFLWIYVLWLMFLYFKKYTATVPQWFGYMAIAATSYAWHILFSPLGHNRANMALFWACLLLARSVGKGKLSLSNDMLMEAKKYE